MHGAGGGRPVKHGRYSKVLTRLRERFEDARDREVEDLLDVRPTLALLDLHIEELLRRIEDGDESAWAELSDAVDVRSRRTEAAWGIRLRAGCAVNARELTAVFEKLVDILIQDLGREAATPILLRFQREIVGPLERRPQPA